MAEQLEQVGFNEYIRNWMKKNIDEFADGQKELSKKDLIHFAQMFNEKHFVELLVIAAEVAVEYEESKK